MKKSYHIKNHNLIMRTWQMQHAKPGTWLFIFLAIMLTLPKPALADLMLYPTRVVLEPKQRSAQLQIMNRGNKPETYRINIVNRRMTENGEIVPADTPQAGEHFASDMLRYSPRQVTLKPGVAQIIRIIVRKPANLADGEYRSHLQFDRVPDTNSKSDLEAINKPEPGQLSISIEALIGASIPVIVRHGETIASASLDNLALEPTKENTQPTLTFGINRSGNRSVYGDLVASYTPVGGEPIEIAKVGGVAVYVPNAKRIARLPLKLPEGVSLKGGKIQLNYLERPELGSKVIAQAELALK
ncbi:MAG: fimbria/pilus periplasmic chaperone [Methylotenera sp.]